MLLRVVGCKRVFAYQNRAGVTMRMTSTLLRDGGKSSLIGGEWIGTKKVFSVKDPATGDILVDGVPDMGEEETQRAISAASGALEAWCWQWSARERSRFLRRWYEAITEATEELAQLMTLECGKPLAEARAEVAYGASFLEWFAEEGPRAIGNIDTGASDRRLITTKRAVGVAAMITPWNFPLAMITRKCGAALAAGAVAVVKPSEETPLTALALAALAHDVGLPPGVLNIVTASKENTPSVGSTLCTSPTVRALSFTGSTAVGKLLYQQCAGTVKKVGLELGGNAPFLVLSDADPDFAADVLMKTKFRNAGQTCVCADRFLVHDHVFDDFLTALKSRIKSNLKLGRGLDPSVTLGPLITTQAAERIRDVIDEARSSGSQVWAPVQTTDQISDAFVSPTIIHVDPNLSRAPTCWSKENFGPVVPLLRVRASDDEMIAMANDDPGGLAAYVVGTDLGRAWRVAERLDAGLVGVNEAAISTANAPFGGVKQSGLGREGGIGFGLHEYLEDKYICFGNLKFN